MFSAGEVRDRMRIGEFGEKIKCFFELYPKAAVIGSRTVVRCLKYKRIFDGYDIVDVFSSLKNAEPDFEDVLVPCEYCGGDVVEITDFEEKVAAKKLHCFICHGLIKAKVFDINQMYVD